MASNTNRETVVVGCLKKALGKLMDLQTWLEEMKSEMKSAIERADGSAFNIQWCEVAAGKFFDIYNNVARANGASLVRSLPAEDASDERCNRLQAKWSTLSQAEREDLLREIVNVIPEYGEHEKAEMLYAELIKNECVCNLPSIIVQWLSSALVTVETFYLEQAIRSHLRK